MDHTTNCVVHPSVLAAISSKPGTPIDRQSLPKPLRKFSTNRAKQREEFFTKYSPLSSKDIFRSQYHRSGHHIPSESISYLDPTGTKAYNWLLVVGIAVIYFTWSIVARISFSGFQALWYVWVPLDCLFTMIYVADVIMQSRTSYLKDGILEEDVEKLVDRYTKSWQFYVDFISAIPMDWLYLIIRCSYPPLYLHFPKLLKLYRLKQFFDRTESLSHFPNISRVLFLLYNMIVIIHWNACIYFTLSEWIGFGSDNWVYPAWNTTELAHWGEVSRQYIYSLYWSTLTLTTIGELPHPQTNVEYVFVISDYLIGVLMFATIVGNVGNIISNTQKSKTKFQTKMDNIKGYMTKTHVPEHLREKVIKWFDYLWTHGHPVDDQHVLNTLPEKLKAEIGIYVHFETLKKVDFFSACEPGLLWELVVRLKTQVYSPGEYVCRKGDVGREMYIVNSGKLQVMAEEDGVVLKELKDGEYFGEISVLNLGTGKSHRRRTAFVRSVGFSTLLYLSKNDLLDVLKDYPDTMEMLVAKGKKRLSRDSVVVKQADSLTYIKEESEDEEDEGDSSSLEDILPERKLSNDSTSTSDFSTSFHAQTIADRVNHLHTRMDQMEELLTQVLEEIKASRVPKDKGTPLPIPPMPSTLYRLTERIRKVSSQF